MKLFKINVYNTRYQQSECYYRKADTEKEAIDSVKAFLWGECYVTSTQEVDEKEVRDEEKKWMWIWWMKL